MATTAAIIGAVGAIAGAGTAYVQGEDAKKEAKKARKKEEARIAEQERLIAAEETKQLKVAEERKSRLKKNELLSGTETGVTQTSPSLLGASK